MKFLSDILIGVTSGVLVLLVDRFCSALFRRRRAQVFTGRYLMCHPQTEKPRGGQVTVEYSPSWSDWFLGEPTELSVFAEHDLGTENWTATLDIRSSDTAIGYFRYPKSEGGELRFTRLRDSPFITEFGTPHVGGEPFIRLLKPVSEKAK